MIERKQYKGITWIDIESPTAEEIEEVSKQFKLHPLISTELGQPSARPKIDPYHDYIYTILHFPIYQHKVLFECAQKDVIFSLEHLFG